METNIATIVDMIADLNSKVTLDEKLSFISDDDFDRIYEQVNNLRINIYNHKEVSNPSKDRLEELTDIMTMIPQFDFSKKAFVGNEENHLDYIAIGLNLLSHQLEKRVTPLLAYEKIFNSIKDIAIITDAKGFIKYLNPSASNWLKYQDQEIAGKNISSLLRHPGLLNYINNEKEVEIEIVNKKRELLQLGITISRITDESGLHEGTVYLGRVRNSAEQRTAGPENTEKINIRKINFNSVVRKIVKDVSLFPNFLFLDFKVKVNQKEIFYSSVNHVETVIRNMFSYSLLLRKGTGYIYDRPAASFELTIEDCDNGVMIGAYDNGVGINVEEKPAMLLDGLCKTTIAEDKYLALYLVKESVKIINGKLGVGMRYHIFLPNMAGQNTEAG